MQTVASDAEVILLSKKGQFVSRRFSVSGGSLDAFQGNRIGRKKNLELLKAQTEELFAQSETAKQEIATLEQQLTTYKNATKVKQIKQEQQQLDQLTKQFISLQTRLENFQTFLDDVNSSQAFKQEQVDKIALENATIGEALAEKRAEANHLRANISNRDSSYRTIADDLARASEEYNS